MKKTMNSIGSSRSATRTGFYATALATTVLVATLLVAQTAQASITSSLDLGSTGTQVTELQTYLATNATIYPERLVTGYYGALTEAAVQRFQVAQGIVTSGTPASTGYGRVGPTTMARINALNNGTPISTNTPWDSVPVIGTPSVSRSNTTATFTWSTNEVTTGQVFWSAMPITSDEATGPRQQPYVSGALALDAGGMQTAHTVTVSNLQANTVYYYLVRGIDSVGNMSMTLPGSFRTAN